MRLDADTLTRLPARVSRPSYDRTSQQPGVVHFGIGTFHRAHQAVVFDDAMHAGERDWAITGVSLRSASVADQMNPQGGLYTLATRSGETTDYRLVGSVRRVLVAAEDRPAVAAALASPVAQIATFTVTEKGYCRAPDGSLDLELAHPGSIHGLLRDGLARRRSAGLPGLTLLSCDNLAHNGAQLERLFLAYLDNHDPALADWVRSTCTFPSSMVDRIVPATTEADLKAAEAVIGLRDEAHVGTEPFRQWVIEDRFAGPRPQFEDYGVEIVANVAPYEMAKLRMLNGAHSLLAYVGLAHGHEFVHQAVNDPAIRALAERLMREEASPSIDAAPGQDLPRYASSLLERFANPLLNHRLSQIAMDGSQKLPQRWLETLACNLNAKRDCPAILTGLAAWLLHVRGDVRPVEDPMAKPLAQAWRDAGHDVIAAAVLGRGGLLASRWQPDTADLTAIAVEMRRLERRHGTG